MFPLGEKPTATHPVSHKYHCHFVAVPGVLRVIAIEIT